MDKYSYFKNLNLDKEIVQIIENDIFLESYSIGEERIMRQIQLEKHSFQGASIIVATVEDILVKSPIDQGDGKNAKERIRHPGVTPKGCLRE